ncbi:glycosyltransferase [Geodermatophilus sp. TF02-6]|uniref:WecB/TagA/CpsF family glycosyltransferase n=1 Tax=Geodermatophilus sp. TF02-6 TaxID=2250575 RepID=UPI000DEA8B74|nr:WecB/TagA/CpsF family glycosyltransferase [Geodermatophilus sp. TF02-6]RBY75305.1 glycosyltransferase [Geodermatophilus sp. TF02-6]
MGDETTTTTLVGMPFPHWDQGEACRTLLAADRPPAAVPWRLVNTHTISLMRDGGAYADLLRSPGVNLADGRPVAWLLGWLSRRSGCRTAPRHVRGPGLFARVLDESQDTPVSHYLLGGTPQTLDALQRVISVRFPGARIAGADSPPFRPLTAAEVAAQDARIRHSGADIVWVGLGTPRQDVEAARLAATVRRPAIAVGAAFDFLAGTRPEAPVWVQRLTLEWLFRLLSEPSRLWRRYTIGLLRFAGVTSADLLRRGTGDRVGAPTSPTPDPPPDPRQPSP